MSAIIAEAAAQTLFAARSTGQTLPRLPEAMRPLDLETAIAVQNRMVALLQQSVGGWKCSVPSPARAILAAPIMANTIGSASPCTMVVTGTTAKIEPEIAFVLGRDLPQRATPYTDDEVRAAIKETRLVLELIGSRYADPAAVDYPEHLADCVANQGLFVGPVVADAHARDLTRFPVTVTKGGSHSEHAGVHGDGHPLRPLVWLANERARRGDPLRAGQIVTTGSYAGVIEVPLNVPITIHFGDLGRIDVTFRAAA